MLRYISRKVEANISETVVPDAVSDDSGLCLYSFSYVFMFPLLLYCNGYLKNKHMCLLNKNEIKQA